MYAVINSRYVSIPVEQVNSILGYAPGNDVQGLSVPQFESRNQVIALIQGLPEAEPPDWVAPKSKTSNVRRSSERQISEASECWRILVDLASKGETTTYAELGSLVGIHRRTVQRPLSRIQDHCLKAGLPPLTVLVVNASTGFPGLGSIVSPVDVPREQERVHGNDWTSVRNPFDEPSARVEESYGEIPGFPEGSHFDDRSALRIAGLHRQEMGGISYPPNGPADAIVISGGYVDDVDDGDAITYTGQGGRRTASEPATDQILHRGNLALMKNRDQGIPVRVIRGSGGNKRFSPPAGYRYDGLFEVEDGWEDVSQYGKKIYRYRLRKLPDDEGQTWTTEAPGTATPPGPAPSGTEKPPKGASKSTIRVIRDTKITRWVKRTHDFTCQICATRLKTPASAYAEGAHIRPLGAPHDGADTVENMLCLCPNCHTLFDHGGLYVNEESMEVVSAVTKEVLGSLRQAPGHHVDATNLHYHRDHVAYS
ncbi:MAG: YDG/SRA domain-containing protein [Acidimicrobiales bacterium]